MKIKRTIEGKEYEFELTTEEVNEAGTIAIASFGGGIKRVS